MNRVIRTITPGLMTGVSLLFGSTAASAQVTVDWENRNSNVGTIMVWRADEYGTPLRQLAFGSSTLIRDRAMVTAGHFTSPVKALGRMLPAQSLIRSGVLGGVAGWILGSVAIGIPLAQALPATDDGLSTPGIIIGFELGQAVGIPTGVHLANGRKGDFRKSLFLSAAAAALGTTLLWTDDFDAVFETPRGQVILVAVPLVQLVSSIYFARTGPGD